GRYVSNTLIPEGAHFDGSNSRPFDENSIVRHGQAYGTPGRSAPSGSRNQPHRAKSHSRVPSPAAGPVNAAPSVTSPTPAPSAPGTKSNPHAKPSPATPMPVQPTHAK